MFHSSTPIKLSLFFFLDINLITQPNPCAEPLFFPLLQRINEIVLLLDVLIKKLQNKGVFPGKWLKICLWTFLEVEVCYVERYLLRDDNSTRFDRIHLLFRSWKDWGIFWVLGWIRWLFLKKVFGVVGRRRVYS